MNKIIKENLLYVVIIFFILYIIYKEIYPLIELSKNNAAYVNIIFSSFLSGIISYFVSKIASSSAVNQIETLRKDVNVFKSESTKTTENITKKVNDLKFEEIWKSI